MSGAKNVFWGGPLRADQKLTPQCSPRPTFSQSRSSVMVRAKRSRRSINARAIEVNDKRAPKACFGCALELIKRGTPMLTPRVPQDWPFHGRTLLILSRVSKPENALPHMRLRQWGEWRRPLPRGLGEMLHDMLVVVFPPPQTALRPQRVLNMHFSSH